MKAEEHRTKENEKHLHQQPGSLAVNRLNPQPKEHGSLVYGFRSPNGSRPNSFLMGRMIFWTSSA
jgi:hypothetical protein